VNAASVRFSTFHLACALGGGFVLLFILAPLVGMVVASDFRGLWATATEEEAARSIGLTMWTSMAGTLLLAVPAVPFAWLLAHSDFTGKRVVLGLIDLPVVVPHSAAGIALLCVLNRESLAGRAGEAVGLSFIGTPWGIMAAMAFVSLPFLIGAAREGFAAVPQRLEKAALTLGASPWRVFWTVSLPLAWRPVLTGIIMMFARGLSEFGAVVIIAYHPMITPTLIFDRFNSFGLRYARPAAVVFLAICLVVFVGLRLLSGGKRAER
jgi:molybdate/tungstate transport system permease protein